MDREKLVYDIGKYKYDFRKFKTIRTFGKDIYEGKITLEQADEEQSDLSSDIDKLIKETKPKSAVKKSQRKTVMKNLRDFINARELVLNGFKSKLFLTKSVGSGILSTNQSKFKILTPKKMLQRLPITLAQVKAGNNSQYLLNEIRQIVYSLYQSKEITKKVYNNIINSW